MATTISTTIDPQVESRLVHIPLEVLLRITRFINTEELGNVRLSCKGLERSLFNFFSHEFFRKKQFMVSSFSLQALIDISKHPALSPVLKHVIICTDRLGSYGRVASTDEHWARYEEAKADHKHLLCTGGLRDMLAEAFSDLPNLETVDIRDFHSRSRNRDGRGTPWRSYGSQHLRELTNFDTAPNPHSGEEYYVTELYCATTTALATAQARPKNLEVLLRSAGWHGWGLQDSAFYIPPRMEAPMARVLENLKSLHLSITMSRLDQLAFLYQKFLSFAPNLTWLRLNYTNAGLDELIPMFSWLALKDNEASQNPRDWTPIPLAQLERLDLGSADITAPLLLKLVSKFAPTLTSLYLRRVCMYKNIQEAQLSKTNHWLGFLSALPRVAGPNFRVLDISEPKLTCESASLFRGGVTFKSPDPARPARNSWTCSTKTLTLEKATAEAADAMHVEWPSVPDPMDEDDASEDGSDDEEEEEEGSDSDAGDDEE